MVEVAARHLPDKYCLIRQAYGQPCVCGLQIFSFFGGALDWNLLFDLKNGCDCTPFLPGRMGSFSVSECSPRFALER